MTVGVKNIPGTSNAKLPSGYDSWIDFYARNHGLLSSAFCANCSCHNHADVGAHVSKAYSSDRAAYIIPLCYNCNNYNHDKIFYVDESMLEPIRNF